MASAEIFGMLVGIASSLDQVDVRHFWYPQVVKFARSKSRGVLEGFSTVFSWLGLVAIAGLLGPRKAEERERLPNEECPIDPVNRL